MNEWLASIGLAAGDHLWQSTLFAVVAASLTALLKKNQARARYWIWLAALMKFLVPFSLLIGLGGLLPRPQYDSVTTPTAYAAMDTMSEPFAAEALPVTPNHIAKSAEYGIPEAVASVWFCGLAVVLAMSWMRWPRVAAVVRETTEADAAREAEVLRWLERDAGVRPVQLLLSRSSMEPGMFGVVRPVLLWPEGISARLSDGQMEAILAHELGHVRRRDNLFAMAQMVVETVFWFYPLVWWMGTRMVEERERACDEEVLGQGRSADSTLATLEIATPTIGQWISRFVGSEMQKSRATIRWCRSPTEPDRERRTKDSEC
jgi:bla regulator protein BlaR1